MLEALEVPLERALGAQMGMLVADIHREHGVDVRLGVGVDGFDADEQRRVTGRAAVGRLDRAGRSRRGRHRRHARPPAGSTAPASRSTTVWWSTSSCGRRLVWWPSATSLGGRRPGSAASPGSSTGRTPSRWASTRPARCCASPTREAADPSPRPTTRCPWFWSDQYDRKIQLAGHSGADDDFEVVHGSDRGASLRGHLRPRAGRLVGVFGINRPRHVMLLRQLLVDGASWDDAVAFGREL